MEKRLLYLLISIIISIIVLVGVNLYFGKITEIDNNVLLIEFILLVVMTYTLSVGKVKWLNKFWINLTIMCIDVQSYHDHDIQYFWSRKKLAEIKGDTNIDSIYDSKMIYLLIWIGILSIPFSSAEEDLMLLYLLAWFLAFIVAFFKVSICIDKAKLSKKTKE